jgi:hypothetical protein
VWNPNVDITEQVVGQGIQIIGGVRPSSTSEKREDKK